MNNYTMHIPEQRIYPMISCECGKAAEIEVRIASFGGSSVPVTDFACHDHGWVASMRGDAVFS